MVVHALDSRKSTVSPRRISLHARTETLLYILEHVAQPEAYDFGCTLWSIFLERVLLKDENYLGLQTANRTVKDQYPRDQFTFLAAFLTSTRCPEKLLPDILPQMDLLHVASLLRHDEDLSIGQLGQKMEQTLQSVNYSTALENDVSEEDVDDMSSAQESMNQYRAQFYIGTPHQTPAASPSGFPTTQSVFHDPNLCLRNGHQCIKRRRR